MSTVWSSGLHFVFYCLFAVGGGRLMRFGLTNYTVCPHKWQQQQQQQQRQHGILRVLYRADTGTKKENSSERLSLVCW
jgi:hypothetical protein